MASIEPDIAVRDEDAPDTSRSVASTRVVEVVVYLLLLGLAVLLGVDNWRSGAGWAPEGPQAGYLPFYLCVILGGASLYGLALVYFRSAAKVQSFLTRNQLRRVMQVFVPTLAFCIVMQWLGIYVASFLLVAGFMMFIGKIAAWKSLLTGFLFAAVMFATFEIAFDVLMPKGPLETLLGF